MSMLGHANDAMIARLTRELEERKSAIQGIIATAQEAERDLNKSEQETLEGLRRRVTELENQLNVVQESTQIVERGIQRAQELDAALMQKRRDGGQEIEYRSAGQWALDSYQAHLGDRKAAQRLELYHRVAAHQKTSDNPGIIPDPIVGNLINFIDASRPLVSFIGTQPMTTASWHRPKVIQHTQVAAQGSAGAASDEKSELNSRKMTIQRLTGSAVTYGGYVNVSRQNIDFSSPQALDLIINDLAGQYAIETEAALAAEIGSTGADSVNYDETAAGIHSAVWQAVAQVYAAVKGQGRLFIAVAPDRLSLFGPLFAPINVLAAAIAGQGGQTGGFSAMNFGQGIMGSLGGIPVIMSAGLGEGEAFVASTAAIETFEQRVGTLQVVEPSVLGVQVAYAGYFTPLTIEEDGIVPLVSTES